MYGKLGRFGKAIHSSQGTVSTFYILYLVFYFCSLSLPYCMYRYVSRLNTNSKILCTREHYDAKKFFVTF